MKTPYKNEYKHKEGVFSYKMDYSKMFSWNPSYQLISNNYLSEEKDNEVSIAILKHV